MRLSRFTLTLMLFICLIGCPCLAGTLASIYICPGDFMLRPGMQQQFQVFGLDADGNSAAVPGPLTWSADSRAGTVTSAGLFTAGSQTGMYPSGITVSAPGGFTAVCVIEVFDAPSSELYAPVAAWGGSGAGHLRGPVGVAVSSTGRIYVSESLNARVEAFDTSGNYITMWGSQGSNSVRHSDWSQYGLAVDSQGNVYVADNTYYCVREFGPDGALIRTIGDGYGAEDGRFQNIADIAVDSSGYVYVLEGDRVQKFASNGTFLTKWSPSAAGDAQSAYAVAIAVDSASRTYVCDSSNNSVKIYDTSGTLITQWAGGRFTNPAGVEVDSSGNVWVADKGGSLRVQKLDTAGNVLSSWNGSQVPLGYYSSIGHLAVDSSGNVYLVDYQNDCIHKYTSSGQLVKRWGALDKQAGQFHGPNQITADPSGSIYVYEDRSYSIRKFDPGLTFSTQWGSYGTGNGQFDTVTGLAAGPDGCLYVLDWSKKALQKFSSSGAYVTKWTCGAGTFPSLADVAIDGSGTVYVLDGDSGLISKYTSQGASAGSIRYTANTPSSYQDLRSIALDRQGYVYLTDFLDGWVRKINQTGVKLLEFGQRGYGAGQLYQMCGMSVDSHGNIIVAGANRVNAYGPSGTWIGGLTNQGRQAAGTIFAEDVAVDPSGNLFIVDSTLNRVTKFVPRLSGVDLAKTKSLADGQFVSFTGQVITADTYELGDCFYIQPPTNGVNGIKVTGRSGIRGYKVAVDGTLATVNGEREIQARSVTYDSDGTATPRGMRIKDLGGRSLGLQNGLKAYKIDGSGYVSEPMTGMNNVGLLVKVWGRIKSVDTTSRTFMFNDGGFYNVKCKVPTSVTMPTASSNIYAVTGVVSTEKTASGDLMPLLRLRDSDDLLKLWP